MKKYQLKTMIFNLGLQFYFVASKITILGGHLDNNANQGVFKYIQLSYTVTTL